MSKFGGDRTNPLASPESFNRAAGPADGQTQVQDDDHVVEEAREKVYFLGESLISGGTHCKRSNSLSCFLQSAIIKLVP